MAEKLAQKPGAMDGLKAACGAANLRARGCQVELVESRTLARPQKMLGQASGPVGGCLCRRKNELAADLVAKEWHDFWRVGTECQIDFGGVNNAPVVPSPSPDDLRDVCGSVSAHTLPLLPTTCTQPCT